MECRCLNCLDACKHRPGWFKPGEVEKVAEHLDVSIDKLFRHKLAVDWWEAEKDVFVLAPALKGEEAGTEYPGDPRAECVFFQNGLCEIHPVKPFECKEANHNREKSRSDHQHASDAWNTPEYQAKIEKLLGRKPVAGEFDGSFSWLSLF